MGKIKLLVEALNLEITERFHRLPGRPEKTATKFFDAKVDKSRTEGDDTEQAIVDALKIEWNLGEPGLLELLEVPSADFKKPFLPVENVPQMDRAFLPDRKFWYALAEFETPKPSPEDVDAAQEKERKAKEKAKTVGFRRVVPQTKKSSQLGARNEGMVDNVVFYRLNLKNGDQIGHAITLLNNTKKRGSSLAPGAESVWVHLDAWEDAADKPPVNFRQYGTERM